VNPNSENFPALRTRLRNQLTPGRYAHSLATAGLAVELARRHGGDPKRAYLAGLLHDCARDLSPEQLAAVLKVYRGPFLDPAVRATPELWHDPAGVVLARREYGVCDAGVLRAIVRHSTGGPDMALLEKIIYVADFSEPLRGYPEAKSVRELARRDLDAAVAGVVRAKLEYLRQEGKLVHPLTKALAKELGVVFD